MQGREQEKDFEKNYSHSEPKHKIQANLEFGGKIL